MPDVVHPANNASSVCISYLKRDIGWDEKRYDRLKHWTKTKKNICRWEESKKWQHKVDQLKSKLKDADAEVSKLAKANKSLREINRLPTQCLKKCLISIFSHHSSISWFVMPAADEFFPFPPSNSRVARLLLVQHTKTVENIADDYICR
jgi:hypothetical protein